MELFHDFFNYPFGGLHFLTRYAHILFGITWIGLLYFFNVVNKSGLIWKRGETVHYVLHLASCERGHITREELIGSACSSQGR
jgi:hypothetical protein